MTATLDCEAKDTTGQREKKDVEGGGRERGRERVKKRESRVERETGVVRVRGGGEGQMGGPGKREITKY